MANPSIQIDQAGFCTRSDDDWLIIADEDEGCCCGAGITPEPCGCSCVGYRPDCGLTQDLAPCPCPADYDFQFDSVRTYVDGVTGSQYGWYLDEEHVRHDWSADLPSVSTRFTETVHVRLRVRCDETTGTRTYDLSGSTRDVTDRIDLNQPQPDIHYVDNSGPRPFLDLTGLLGFGFPANCGVVSNPPLSVLQLGPDLPCSDAERTFTPWYYTDQDGVSHRQADAETDLTWSSFTNCDGGHADSDEEFVAESDFDAEADFHGEHNHTVRRRSDVIDATWSRTLLSTCPTDPCAGHQLVKGACCGAFFGSVGHPLNCASLTADECLRLGGSYQGDGTACDEVTCPPAGACCLDVGGCINTTEFDCEFLRHGTWLGPDTDCLLQPCPVITGACCLPSGQGCITTPQTHCDAVGGVWMGLGTVCTDTLCDGPPGACCLPDGTCNADVHRQSCGQLGGTFLEGQACDACPQIDVGACCIVDGFGHQSCYENLTQQQCDSIYTNLPLGTYAPRENYAPGASCAAISCGPTVGRPGQQWPTALQVLRSLLPL